MKYWLQVLAYGFAMFIGLEVLCRLFIGHSPAMGFDSRFDRITLPNQPVVHSSEGFSRGRTNELGHLDAPMPVPVPANGILVVGDSYTEARQIAREERFTERLEALLNRRVYNVGHTGWSPVNALAFLVAERARFAPSTVIVQVSANDLSDIVASKRPHVTRGMQGFEIVIPKRTKAGLAEKITTVREAISSRSAFGGQAIVALWSLFNGKDVDGEGGEAKTCAAPTPFQVDAMAWLVAELSRAHPDVRLLYLPDLDYHAGCIDRCVASRRMFELVAEARGVRFIDVTSAMCERFTETRQPLHGFRNSIPGAGHVNAEGHEIIARQVARDFEKR